MTLYKDHIASLKAHKRWSYWKSAVRIVGFALLIIAEALGVLEEKDAA